MRSLRTRDWHFILNLHPEFAYHTHIDLAQADTGYWASWTNAAPTDPRAALLVQRYHQRPAEELYDVRNDPFETNNLALRPELAGRVKIMREELEAWMVSQGDTRRVYGEPRKL